MPVAAVPRYLPEQLLARASPGLRFGMYLRLWGVDRRSRQLLWTTSDTDQVRGQDMRERDVKKENKRPALDEACPLTPSDRRLMEALAQRQQAIAAPLLAAGDLMRIEGEAVAPFTTGLGNEHPLENGFAFLNPYGLPYLPGSGVKGVVRQAARELAAGEWGNTGCWTKEKAHCLDVEDGKILLSPLDVLFGRATEVGDREHVRGALSFWDVVPLIRGERLAVEVMTPHQTHYYQGGSAPHESGLPTPINFLTVPPGSRFVFHVVCDRKRLVRLAPPLAEGGRWQTLLKAAFEHAFQWLGFGAKTAVGYGSFAPVAAPAAPTGAGAPSGDEVIWRGAVLLFRAGGGGRLTISFEGKKAEASGPAAQELMRPLPEEFLRKIKRDGLRADVRVRIDGAMARPLGIVLPAPEKG
jgi:CRISPR-associated protein Cmr6